MRETLTKDQHISDGRGLLAIAPYHHGILRRQTSSSRPPQSVRARWRRGALGDSRRFLRDAGRARGASAIEGYRVRAFGTCRATTMGWCASL